MHGCGRASEAGARGEVKRHWGAHAGRWCVQLQTRGNGLCGVGREGWGGERSTGDCEGRRVPGREHRAAGFARAEGGGVLGMGLT